MTEPKNITFIFNRFENEHFGKDVFLVPYYLGKLLNLNVTIVYSQTKDNKNFPPIERSVILKPIKNVFYNHPNELFRGLFEIFYTLFNAKKITVLFRFFFSNISALTGYIYKKFNKNGLIIIKSDGKFEEWPLLGYYESLKNTKNKLLFKIKQHFYKTFLEYIDLIMIETKAGYNQFINNSFPCVNLREKVKLVYNGFDKELFDSFNIHKNNYIEKENIILVVGRLGTYPKNTEMILNSVKKIAFENWKIVLIGPLEKIEQNFQEKINLFFIENPHLKNSVIFTGPIYNKKELWQWYNSSKIFVLPSISEGFSIVLTEALFFRNYILSTNVGGAKEIIKMGYGEIIPHNDTDYLANAIQTIIDTDNISQEYNKVEWDKNDVSWESLIKNALSGILLK